MPDIHFDCPQCHTHIETDESARGQRVSCPKCGKQLIAMPGPASQSGSSSFSQGGSANTFCSDVEIKGTLICKQATRFDGKIIGEIHADSSLNIGPNGSIEGDIYAGSVSLGGKVKGNITARDRCELKTNSELVGNLKSPRLAMEEGAVFAGRSEIMPNKIDLPKSASNSGGSSNPQQQSSQKSAKA